MYNPNPNNPYGYPRRHIGRWIALGFLTVFAVLVAAMIYFMFQYGPQFMAGTGAGYYWSPFGFLWAFFLVFLLFGLLRFAFWGPRWWGGYYRRGGYGPYGRQNEAYHIVRERYARGEITKDQYDAMMRDLYQQPPQTPPR